MSAEQVEQKESMHADRPIRKRVEDKLGRVGFARSIAAQIQRAPRGESFVIGLVGPWGSGKTSILNLIKEDIEQDSSLLFLWFNPWLFSGHQQLVAHFFQEIAAQLRDQGGQDLRDIWRGFEGYSRLLRPLRAVPGTEGESREPSVRRQRELLEEALLKARQRLVIVIDDLDRLEDDEIRDVMRLVRLLADFPNTMYLLSYDQKRVAHALGGEERGKAYLEKIVQVVHHVPEIRKSDLTLILAEAVNEILQSMPHLPVVQADLDNTFMLGIRPLFGGLRDVYRYANALRPAFEQMGDEIALPDVMALEALRVLEPAVFVGLAERMELLTSTAYESSSEDRAIREASKQSLFAMGGIRASQVQKLITRLFPAMGRAHHGPDWLKIWRKQRRVAHPDVLRIYIERTLPEGVSPARVVREFVEKLNDEKALVSYLAPMNSMQLEELFERLEGYEDDFCLEEDGIAVKVLLDQFPRLREGTQHIFDMGSDAALANVVRLLLRKLDPGRRLKIIECQLPRIQDLSARSMLIEVTRLEEERLLDEPTATRLAGELARAVIDAPVGKLSSERNLMRLLHDVRVHDESSMVKKTRVLIMDDSAFLRLLTSGMYTSRSGPMNSVVMAVEYGLSWWDDLVSIVGVDVLKQRIHVLDARRAEMALGERETHAIDAALKYLDGWRPKSHMSKNASTIAGDAREGEEVKDEQDDKDEEDEASMRD
jgi:hypothetical protein